MTDSVVRSLDDKFIIDIVNNNKTPLYIYDGDLIYSRYEELKEFIPYPDLRILYALKANYNPLVLEVLRDAGCFLDTVSPTEVELALTMRFEKERILFTANNITDEEMDKVHSMGVLMNIDSLSRLKKFSKAYPNSEVCLRFNPEVVAGHHKKVMTGGDLTKFGILLEDADEAVRIAKENGVKIVGLHKHTGSGIKDTSKFLKSVNNLLNIATRERFSDLQFIDFGGGFAVPYHPDEERIDYKSFGKIISDRFKEWTEEYGRKIGLYFEPGRYLVAESGVLVVTANTIKENHGRLIVGTDSGFPQLIRPMFYDSYHHIDNLSNPDAETKTYDICGNICETGDLFAKDRKIPEIREGDLLAIRTAGAYCYSMGGVYNLRPMPQEIIIRYGEITGRRNALKGYQLINQILGECQNG